MDLTINDNGLTKKKLFNILNRKQNFSEYLRRMEEWWKKNLVLDSAKAIIGMFLTMK